MQHTRRGPELAALACFFHVRHAAAETTLGRKGGARKNTLAVLSDLAVGILDYVCDHGRVTTRDMVREAGASPNTRKATFTSLVEKGLLVGPWWRPIKLIFATVIRIGIKM